MPRRLYLLRHGQTDANILSIIQGRLNLPLNDTGLKQAELAAEVLAGVNFSFIYTSPALRARETAKKIFENQRRPVLSEVNLNLSEINFGILEGKTFDEAKNLYPDLFQIYKEKPSQCVFPCGEKMVESYERITKAINFILASHPHGENILVVSHGGAMALIFMYLFDLDMDKMFHAVRHNNCGLSIIDLKSFVWNIPDHRPKIICLNDISHLKEEHDKRLADRL